MADQEWRARAYSLEFLERAARLSYGRFRGVFPWLKFLGLVPQDVATMPVADVNNGADKDALKAGYLASAAYEWDSWGESDPTDFMKAIHQEVACEEKDRIASILNIVGAMEREQLETTPTFKCHVAMP